MGGKGSVKPHGEESQVGQTMEGRSIEEDLFLKEVKYEHEYSEVVRVDKEHCCEQEQLPGVDHMGGRADEADS